MPFAASGDLLHGAHALLGRHAHVELIEGVAHGDTGLQVIDARRNRPLGALGVRHEGRVAHVRPPGDAGEHALRVGELRHHLGMGEAR